MGSFNGTWYGAYASNQIYLIIANSNDTTGDISGTLLNYGNSWNITGHYYISTAGATVMLDAFPVNGGTKEQWQLSTSDYKVLSGQRTYLGPVGGFVTEQIGGLGKQT
ncbi:hypothetical protein [Pseudomonas sp. NPDC096950]|uniref:hypothetical protein n=1 Tax=Pseudomonas sp. NPDC096950 TaxID=3364485 RepID=UPI00383B2F46